MRFCDRPHEADKKGTAMDMQEIIEECGFDAVGEWAAQDLEAKDEVRAMCAAGRCNRYGKSWSCPPACGDIAYFQDLLAGMGTCYVVQTYGDVEDSFDIETMMELEDIHKKRVHKLNDLVSAAFPDALVLSAGSCTVCSSCTYPDAPCRFPNRQLVSMEAAGLVVTEVCIKAGIPYNHGQNTMSYTSCVVL